MPIKEDCPCTKDCPNHGKCEECRASHAARDYPPACERVKQEN